MTRSLLAMASITLTEVLRQPAFGIVVLVTLFTYALSPLFALFSLGAESSVLKDFGTSTLLLSGWVLTCLAASHVVRREIELRTTLTLLSKPISRELFLMAKFLGVVGAVALAIYVFTLALLLAARQGPLGAHPGLSVDWPVLVGGPGAVLLALLVAGLRNFLGGHSFSSSSIGLSAVFLSAGVLLAACFDPGWAPQALAGGFDPRLVAAALLSFLALVVLGGFAVSVSVWIGRGGTFALTAALFVAGLSLTSLSPAARLGLLVVPEFQFFWIGELFYLPEGELPAGHLASCAGYAAGYVVFYLALGSWGFRHKGL
ncbi:MAG: hypothetical protein O7J95_11875 [Planctomycetota bacterium]|nr:hypothetical protein [Planctomycetota bacterium]